jgi:hypothetical protein
LHLGGDEDAEKLAVIQHTRANVGLTTCCPEVYW